MQMNILGKLLALATVPVILSAAVYYVIKKTGAKKLSPMTQQLIIGVLFGIASAFGTVCGVDVGGATANARDAAPLCAGLLFGAPAGIISGLIGGIHRWIAAYHGAGMYSQLACSVSTVLSGIYAGLLRKYMFENRRVGWAVAALIAVVMEVIHMTILFLTHLTDAQQAFEIVKAVMIPMIVANSFSVGLSAALLELMAGILHRGIPKKETLAEKIQKWLLLTVFIAYIVSTLFVFGLQTSLDVFKARQLIETNLEDAGKDIRAEADYNMLLTTKALIGQYLSDGNDNTRLAEYAETYGFKEINIVDGHGFITHSTEPAFVGFDMSSGAQSSEFLRLNENKIGSYAQEFGAISFNASGTEQYRKYAAVVLPTGGFLQTGYDYEGYHNSLSEVLLDVAKNRRIGQNGYILIADVSGKVLSDYSQHNSGTLKETGIDLTGKTAGVTFDSVVYNSSSMCIYEEAEGFFFIGVLPYEEINSTREANLYINSCMEVMCFALLFTIIYFLIKLIVVNDIHSINGTLKKISGGQLDERVRVISTVEMEELSGHINETVEALNRYIDEADQRMKKDLELAKDIQHSALPSVFPPYPEIRDFAVFATMNTAREVGGDFYDFFLLGDGRLAFEIADVSGKGIPAAMFMMRAKTLIKGLAESGRDAGEVMTEVNDQLCQNNDAGMFVTCWFGILDYSNGHIVFVNAGHNPPLLCGKDGYRYLKTRAGLVLAGMEGIPYRMQELDLNPGDRLFLYTDGVTEATSADTELYGEERLLRYLNDHRDDPIESLPGGVKEDIDTFINGAEQFDDITMLVLEYTGKKE